MSSDDRTYGEPGAEPPRGEPHVERVHTRDGLRYLCGCHEAYADHFLTVLCERLGHPHAMLHYFEAVGTFEVPADYPGGRVAWLGVLWNEHLAPLYQVGRLDLVGQTAAQWLADQVEPTRPLIPDPDRSATVVPLEGSRWRWSTALKLTRVTVDLVERKGLERAYTAGLLAYVMVRGFERWRDGALQDREFGRWLEALGERADDVRW